MLFSLFSSRGSKEEMSQTKPIIRIKRIKFEGEPLILPQRSQQLDDSEVCSLAAIVNELTISLLDTKAAFCMINSNKGFSDHKWVEEANRCNNGNGVLRRLYEQQARYKMYRMPIYRPHALFVVYLKHLDDRLKHKLAKLDKWSKDYVMKEAIGRIFEHVDRRFYFLSAKPLLDWRLEN